MAMTTEKRAKELAEIDPPRSVLRISDFLRDLTRSGMPRFEPMPAGTGAMLTLAARPPFLPGGGFIEAFARLTRHYAIQAEDLEAFALWLVRWTEKYREMEVIEDPTVYDAPAFPARSRLAAAAPLAFRAEEETLRRTRRRDDPPRPASGPRSPSPTPATSEAAAPAEPYRTPSAANRPLRREPIPEADPPNRIDLAALVRRGQPLTVGAGSMLAGAMIAGTPAAYASQGLAGQGLAGGTLAGPAPFFAAPAAPPAAFGPQTTLFRTLVVQRAGRTVYSATLASPAPSPASAPSAGAPFARAGAVPPPAPFLQPDEPAWPAPPSPESLPGPAALPPGTPSFARPPLGIAGMAAPALDLPGAPTAPGHRPFPSVATVLGAVGLGAAGIGGAVAGLFGHHRPHRASPAPEGPKEPGALDPRGDGPTFGTPRPPRDGAAPENLRPEGGPFAATGPGRARGFAALGGLALAAPAFAMPEGPAPAGMARLARSLAGGGRSGQGRFGLASRSEGDPAQGYWDAPADGDEAPRWIPPTRILSSQNPNPNQNQLNPIGRKARGVDALMDDPRYGQITLIAPPLAVASPQGERAGSAVQFEWGALADRSGQLDAGGMGQLAAMLPPGAQAIYPALPPGSAGANLRLAPSLLAQVLERGYGPHAAAHASRIAAATPAPPGASRPLAASLVPVGRPMGSSRAGILGDDGGALADAGGAQATRGGALDFLGVPVRLAPALGGRADLRQQQAVQSAGADLAAGRPIRPEAFAPLQKRLFPNLGSVAVEPDENKWRKAAPSFGLRGSDPTTVLANDATVKPPTAAGPTPSPSRPSFGSPLADRIARGAGALGAGGLGSGPLGSIPTPAPLRGAFPSGPSAFSPFSAPTPSAFGGPGASPSGAPSPTSRRLGGGAPAIGRPSPFRPVSAPGPAGTGRTTATGAPALQSGGHVPFVERPMEPPAPPALPGGAPRSPRGSVLGPGGASFRPAARATMPGIAPSGASAPRSLGATGAFPTLSAPAQPGGLDDAPSSAPHPLAVPPSPRPSIRVGAPAGPRWGGTTPEMLYAAPPAPPSAAPSLAIQRARIGDARSNPQPSHPSKGPEKTSQAPDGGEAAEINSLATEVWSLLRRRLANEAERRGRF